MRSRLRALLPRLHLFPALSVVVDIGGNATRAALERAGADGDVLIIDESPERLESLRRECTAPNVFFLLGDADVLPLLDGSVDEIFGGDGGADVARVLRT